MHNSGTTTAQPTPARFSTALTLTGWEVVDSDGRAVSDSYKHQDSAAKIAQNLSEAAANGPAALRLALGCIEEEDDYFLLGDDLEVLAHD